MLAEILPKDDDIEGLKATDNWKIIYCYFPGGLHCLVLFLLCTFIKHDSIKNLVTKGDDEGAKYALKKVYKNCNDDNVEQYIHVIK